LAGGAPSLIRSSLRSRTALIAENLFLRKQLALYREHQIQPRRLTNAARLWLVLWSRFFDWKSALLVVKPAALIGWHRRALRLFWKWKSRPGRRRIPLDLRKLIVQMVRANPTWGEERIAHELWLKLGIRVSPRTVRAYWPSNRPWSHRNSQSWNTFVRNHARALLACDFMVAITVRFRVIYVFVVMEIGSRRILHCNVTPHPTAEWTIQQLREAIPSDQEYRSPYSRPACDVFNRARRSHYWFWTEGAEDAYPNSAGECILRAIERNDKKGMPGLYDSAQRTPLAQDCSRMGLALQPSSSALLLSSRNSGFEIGTSAQATSPPVRGGGANRVNAGLGRASP
jgi:hypothetical protein